MQVTVAPAVALKAPRSAAAFIVYLKDERTLVIPTNGRDEVRLVDGLWLPAPGSAVRYGLIDEAPLDDAAMLLDVCMDGGESCDVSEPFRMTFAGGPGLLSEHGEPCSCVYVSGVSDDQPFDWEGEDIEADESEDEEVCEPDEAGELVSSPGLIAVEAGVIHFEEARYTGECAAGMSDWEAGSFALAVVPSYPSRPMSAPEASTCEDAGIDGMDNERLGVGTDCGGDIEYPTLVSGRRARIGVDVSGNSGITSCCALTEPLSLETCPSAVDPCGSLGSGEDEPESDYWVASDGSHLLARKSSGLEVTDRRDRGGARFAVELPEKTAIVGVHFVADASAYLEVIGATPKWRYTSLDDAAAIDKLESTADYVGRVEELIARDQLGEAWRFGLAGLAFEDTQATDNFGTHYDERIGLLRLLEQIATASERTDEAVALRRRADALRDRAADPLR